MGWLDYARLIEQRITNPLAWHQALRANPNTPEDALKLAIKERLNTNDEAALDDLVAVILGLAGQPRPQNPVLVLSRIRDLYLEWSANKMGSVDLQRKRWLRLGKMAERAIDDQD